MKVKSESEVAHSCPTLRDHMDCSLPGSSVHGIFQARVLEWVAIAKILLGFVWLKLRVLQASQVALEEKAMAPHSSTRAWKISWTGTWWAADHGVAKSQTQLSDFNFTFTFHFHALEKEMATHSSILTGRIPGTGEPGAIYGLHRVGHN